MPVTKSAKRALRGSTKKGVINTLITSKLEFALRQAKKLKKKEYKRVAQKEFRAFYEITQKINP